MRNNLDMLISEDLEKLILQLLEGVINPRYHDAFLHWSPNPGSNTPILEASAPKNSFAFLPCAEVFKRTLWRGVYDTILANYLQGRAVRGSYLNGNGWESTAMQLLPYTCWSKLMTVISKLG